MRDEGLFKKKIKIYAYYAFLFIYRLFIHFTFEIYANLI